MSSFPASVVVTAFSGPEVAQRLTDKMAQAAAPRARRYVIRDAQVPGLSLRVGRRSKVWIIRVRFGRHASRRVLGRFPTMTVAQARLEALRWKAERAAGRDPRVASAGKMTFGQTAELFIADLHKRQLRRARETELEVKRHFAEWWSRPVGAITKADVLHVVGNIGNKWAGAHCLANASRLFGFAYDRDLISQIPTDRLRLSKIVGARPPRERVLTDDEIRAVWAAAGQVGVGGILLKTLLLTALRRGELSRAMWSEIDGDVLTVPASRMKMGKSHAVPLVPAVVALLDTLPRFGPHLFSLTGARPFNSWADLKTKIDRLMPPDTPPFVFHDLRRSARTHLSSLTSPDIAERVLAHAVGGIRGVYDKASYLDAKRLALERWSERLRTIIS